MQDLISVLKHHRIFQDQTHIRHTETLGLSDCSAVNFVIMHRRHECFKLSQFLVEKAIKMMHAIHDLILSIPLLLTWGAW